MDREARLRQMYPAPSVAIVLPASVGLICRKLSDLADSQKQIITGMYPVVQIGLAMQATVATVTGSVSQWF